jgi:hypothetical protein
MTFTLLTDMNKSATITAVGETEASNAEKQLARDSQLDATDCRWDGGSKAAIPLYMSEKQFGALLCLKKSDKKNSAKGGFVTAEGSNSLLNGMWICPFHAEPLHFHFSFL